MNEFTKEELDLIQWEVNTAINKLNMANLSIEKHSALIEKIQTMIDNYCEHISDGIECVKCGVFFNDNQPI